jgi:hypothetical protein
MKQVLLIALGPMFGEASGKPIVNRDEILQEASAFAQ